MEKVDFSSDDFAGFSNNEDILVDTGILLAYLNSYDAWSKVVTELFNKHILAENLNKTLFLYINPCVLNEIMNLTGKHKTIEYYMRKHSSKRFTEEEYLRQMNTYKELGSADSFNVSLANDYGISFLTVDNKLVKHIEENIKNFPNLGNVYYAPPEKQSYR
ncbi:MAG: hypothetical protein NC307_09675 [Roseburia sp.]|nr:hypothetical protein [Roseburia sp.]